MKVLINGDSKIVPGEACTLLELFRSLDLSEKGRIVELGGKIYPEAQFDAVTVSDGDQLEIVQFMGGGA